MSAKTCFKCGVSKNLVEFYAHSAMADGHLNKCKECTKLDVHKYRADNIEKVKAYDLARARTPDRIEKCKTYTKAAKIRDPERFAAYIRSFRANQPLKYKAHIMVSNAVRDGKLIKTNCVKCGSSHRVEGHHPDYSKPLEVVWLCCDCHNIEHGKVPIKLSA